MHLYNSFIVETIPLLCLSQNKRIVFNFIVQYVFYTYIWGRGLWYGVVKLCRAPTHIRGPDSEDPPFSKFATAAISAPGEGKFLKILNFAEHFSGRLCLLTLQHV